MKRLLLAGTVAAVLGASAVTAPVFGEGGAPQAAERTPSRSTPQTGPVVIAQAETGPVSPFRHGSGACGPWRGALVARLVGDFDPARARLIAGTLLSAQETAIGIRPDQAEAWRAYTSAVIALIPSGERLAEWRARGADDAPEAFELAEDVADALIERADKARALKAAVERLKASLSPEQLELAKLPHARLRERLNRMANHSDAC